MQHELIFRTRSDAFLNLVINHPSVRPTIQAGRAQLESLNVLSDHRNVCLAGTGGAALFMWQGDGVFEGHIMLVEGRRGAAGLNFGRAALGQLFTLYDARAVTCKVPLMLREARWYVRRLGFVSTGVVKAPSVESYEQFVLEPE